MFRIVHFDSVGSTNDEARRLAAEGAPHGTAVHADEQRSGRGRMARAWFSPPGNLYLSILLRLDVPPGRLHELSFLAAVALAEALEQFLPERAQIALKWPNDVLVDGGKIAGILIEHIEGATILGVGLNVLEAPTGTGYPTATIVGVGGMATVDGARDFLLAALELHLDAWLAQGFPPVRAAWLARGHAIGAALRVSAPGGPVDGAFAGLDADGALLLDTPEGRRRIVAGDVGAPGQASNATSS